MEKTRLDIYLVKNNLAPSRAKAQEMINNGNVIVDDKIITKPSFEITNNNIKILENDLLKYVSRGGLKLQKALDIFNISLNDKIICDIGASKGGFTDCALQHNAKKVYAIDVGEKQLDESLINNPKVINLENLNFKNVTNDIFKETIDLYVCDVSFISIKTILEKLQQLDNKFTIIILYKPQFEVGKSNLNAKGVVKNLKALENSLNEFIDFLNKKNIGIINVTFSPIKGQKEGNIEFLFYLKNEYQSIKINTKELIKTATKVLR